PAQTNDEAADPDVRWTIGRGFFPLLPFAFRLEGWQFAVRELRGSQRLTELAVLSFSTLVWLLPTIMLGWSWGVAVVCSQILAGLYLSALIAPNHIGMPTWPAGARPPFLERQVQSSRNVAPNPVWDFAFGR